ncbi:MAG TPA: hypothetical protein VK714_05650 [Myxococcota bacterium]|nr:hypothetical protein [Myxococcota bacterium]
MGRQAKRRGGGESGARFRDLLTTRDALGHVHTSTTDRYVKSAGKHVFDVMRDLE